ncbi:MAG: response regulator [Candidatus Omnitrophica bacterium]|nr:response regulator [Candidatus Omnitrophota bacterium]
MPVKRILVVDDEPELVKTVQIRLQQADYEVLVAHTGLEGLEKARKEKPDLIILDLTLPEMPGEQVCREIRKDDAIAATPVIMLTAKGSEVDRVIGRVIGADYYMTKPFEHQALLDKTEELLKE